MKVHNAFIHSFIQKGQDDHSYYINMVLYFILKYTLYKMTLTLNSK